MKTSNKIIIGIVTAGIILGAISTFNAYNQLSRIEAERQAKLAPLEAELNQMLNEFTDSCLESLPEGDPTCDIELRKNQEELCESEGMTKYDICRDDRIDQYYREKNNQS
ncbi:MAG TPA: hypothetical protein VNI77_08450 [Nitrososphaera sp.]|nr:hypothetical protein [Nitrososphaera sp.]